MKEIVSIYLSPKAGDVLRSKVANLNQDVPGSVLHDLTFPLRKIPTSAQTVVVAGGDGSAREVVRKVLPLKKKPLVLVLPGGSQNGFYRSLVDAKCQLTLEQVLNKETDQIPFFKPGLVNGQPFVHALGWEEDMLKIGQVNDKFREFMPRQISYIMASVWVGLPRLIAPKSKTFQVSMTSPYLGHRRYLTEDYELISEQIAVASVTRKGTRRGRDQFNNFLDLVMDLEVQKSTDFEIEASPGEQFKSANFDGDILPIKPCRKLHITRHPTGLKVAALDY